MSPKKQLSVVCSKERELGIMATKIDNIENKMTEMHIDLKDFINAAEKKFATKEELINLDVKLSVNEKNANSFKNKIWQMFITLLPYIMFMIVLGVWYFLSTGA